VIGRSLGVQISMSMGLYQGRVFLTPNSLVLLSLACLLKVVYIAVQPKVRAEIPGWPFLTAILVVFYITFPFAA